MKFRQIASAFQERGISNKPWPRIKGAAAVIAGSLISQACTDRKSQSARSLLVAFGNIGDQIKMMNDFSRYALLEEVDFVLSAGSADLPALYQDHANVAVYEHHGAASLAASAKSLNAKSCDYWTAMVPFPFVTQAIDLAFALTHAQNVIAVETQPGRDYVGPLDRVTRVPLEFASWQKCFESFFRACYPGVCPGPRPRVRPQFVHKSGEGKIAIVHSLSAAPNKSLPVSLLRGACERLIGKGFAINLLGSANQEAALRQMCTGLSVETYCGYPLPDVAALMARSTMFVGIDSSMMSLADAVGIPSLIVYGPTCPEITGPFYTRHTAILSTRRERVIKVESRVNDISDRSMQFIQEDELIVALDAMSQ